MPLQKFGKYLIAVLTLLIMGVFIVKYQQDFYKIRNITVSQFLQIFVLSFLTITVNGLKVKLITRSADIHLSFKEWFGLASISISLNGMFSKTGSVVTSNYLKRIYGFPYMSYVGAFTGDFLITLLISAWIGLAISLYLAIAGNGEYMFLVTGFLIILAVLFLLLKSNLNFKRHHYRIVDTIIRAVISLNNLLQNKKLFWNLCCFGIMLLILSALRFYVSSTILHLDIPLSYCFLFTIVIMAVRSLPLVQGDIGTRELAVGLMSEFLGTGLKEGFLVTVVDRIAVLFWCLFFAVLFRNILTEKKPAD